MRSLYVLIFSCLMSLSVFAQSNLYKNIEWINSKAITYEYDESGNPIEREIEKWDKETSEWKQSDKHTTVYDDDGQVISKETFRFDGIEYSKVHATNSEFLTESQNKLVEKRVNWNHKRKSNPVKLRRTAYTNEKGQAIKLLTERWNVRKNEWQNANQTFTEYTPEGKVFEEKKQIWNVKTDIWQNQFLTEKYYFANGVEIESISKKWDKDLNIWIPKTKTFNLYNDKKIALVQRQTFAWDLEKSDWTQTQQVDFTQYEKNSEFAIVLTNDKNSDNLKATSKGYYLYNEQGKIREVVNQKWNTALEYWVSTKRTLYIRDNQNSLVKEIHQIAIPKELATTESSNYIPNPYTAGTPFQFDLPEDNYTLSVFDMNGNKIYSKDFVGGNLAVEKSLPTGTYSFVVISNKKIVHQEKVVFANRK